MPIDKATIIEKFIGFLEDHLKEVEHALSETQRGARDAPGSNVTHSDTSKSRLSDVALGLQKRVLELNEARAAFNNMSPKMSRVGVGAFVGIKNPVTDEMRYYFIVPKSGGYKIEADTISVTSISIGAPFCRLLISKEVGDEIMFQGKEFEIEMIE